MTDQTIDVDLYPNSPLAARGSELARSLITACVSGYESGSRASTNSLVGMMLEQGVEDVFGPDLPKEVAEPLFYLLTTMAETAALSVWVMGSNRPDDTWLDLTAEERRERAFDILGRVFPMVEAKGLTF